MNLTELNPEFLKFPEDIQRKLVERVRGGDISLILMTKKEIEEEVIKEIEHELSYADCVQSTQMVEKKLQGHFSLQEVVERANRVYRLQSLFGEQVQTLLKKEFPKHAGMSEKEFLSYILPLKEKLPEIADMDIPKEHVPFIVVIKNEIISTENIVPLLELEGKKGYTTMDADTIKGFKPIEGVKIPNGWAYLAVDIETGKTSLGKTPDEAIKKIKLEDRSPLTLEECVALIIYHPEILRDQYIWMPGSRRGDGGVAYLWLGGGKPGLGWSWANGSDARWGSASCGRRIGL